MRRNRLYELSSEVRARLAPVLAELAPLLGLVRDSLRWSSTWYRSLPRGVHISAWLLAGFFGAYLLLYVAYRLLPAAWTMRAEPTASTLSIPGELLASLVGLSRDQIRARSGQAIAVRVVKATAEKIEPAVQSAGKIEALETVHVVSKNAGRIERILAEEGQAVEAGQPLAQLERLPLEFQYAEQRAGLEQARARLRLARERFELARRSVEVRSNELEKRRIEAQQLKAELDRARIRFRGQQVLYEEGGLSPDAFNQARTDLIAREAAYLNARKNLDIAAIGFRDEDLRSRGIRVPSAAADRFRSFVDINTRVEKAEAEAAAAEVSAAEAALSNTGRLLQETSIRSPINGLVAERNRSVGEEVPAGISMQSGEPLFVIVGVNQVYAVMDIPESEAVKLKPGMRCQIKLDVFGDEVMEGELRLINPVVAERSHTVEVKALLENPELRLKPGMFLRGRIITGEARESVTVPLEMVVAGQEGASFVFVVRDGRVYRIKVETGVRLRDRIEIKSGVKPGDLLATEKFPLLRDGLPVIVQQNR